ncbi:Protein of unknown function [Gryllus bimaculatus]|nr:Protein of unknown function [Gryllus bimaculatus]
MRIIRPRMTHSLRSLDLAQEHVPGRPLRAQQRSAAHERVARAARVGGAAALVRASSRRPCWTWAAARRRDGAAPVPQLPSSVRVLVGHDVRRERWCATPPPPTPRWRAPALPVARTSPRATCAARRWALRTATPGVPQGLLLLRRSTGWSNQR